MKFFNARRSAYHTNPRQIDDVIYTTYSYGLPDPPPAAPPEHSTPSGATRSGGGGRGGIARGSRRGTASVKWRSSGSDGETTTATVVESPDRVQVDAGGVIPLSPSIPETAIGDLLGVPELAVTDEAVAAAAPTTTTKRKGSKWDTAVTGDAEIFLFSYGTVVIWGMTEQQERRFLSSL